MAVIASGVNPKNDSSQSLKSKRRAIIEDERITQLEKSLYAFYRVLEEQYDITYKVNKKKSIKIEDDKNIKVDIEDIQSLISKYAKTKPIGF